MNNANLEQTKFWIVPELNSLELLSATYISHGFPRHYHDTYVVSIIVSGTEQFTCRSETHFAPTGSIVAINPGEVHTGSASNNQPWVFRAFYPSVEQFEEINSQFGLRKKTIPYFPSPVVFDKELGCELLRLHKILETSCEVLEKQTAFLMVMAGLVKRQSADNPTLKPPGHEPRAIENAREYINSHFTENLPLNEIADAAGLNPFYLIRAFRKKIGLPPHEYLTLLRVRRAMKLLTSGMPIVDVALETGFVDQSHLTNRFKRIVGVTPKQFVQGTFCKTAFGN